MKMSTPINLEFSKDNVLLVLSYGANPTTSPYSHKQIAEWCDKFWFQYMDVDAPEDIEKLLPILADVDAQWDLFLANTFTIKQLQTENFENEQMPVKWFSKWLEDASAG